MATTPACAHLSQNRDVVTRYSPAKPAAAEALLGGPNPWLKLQAIYPHFVRQQTDASCSVATVTTILNTVRAQSLRRPVSQDQVLRTDPSGVWLDSTRDAQSQGVDLDAMALHVLQAFHAFASRHVGVDVRRIGQSRAEFRAGLESALAAGEASPFDNFILINTLQSLLIADGEPVGHMSVVGAWDAKRQRVLVLDVDNRAPMPYWVSIETLIAGMATSDDVTGEGRGYVFVRMDR